MMLLNVLFAIKVAIMQVQKYRNISFPFNAVNKVVY